MAHQGQNALEKKGQSRIEAEHKRGTPGGSFCPVEKQTKKGKTLFKSQYYEGGQDHRKKSYKKNTLGMAKDEARRQKKLEHQERKQGA